MRSCLALALLLVSCSGGPGGSSSSLECSAECGELVATCPDKASSSSCTESCESASDFVWLTKGTAGDPCVVLYMGERDEVPCGIFTGYPCVGDESPDARPSGGADARPGSTPDAGGSTTFERCPIEKSALKVSLPYVSISPPTVVQVGGTCYRQQNNMISDGYNSASAVFVLTDATGSVSITDAGAGLLWQIKFVLDEQAPTSSQLAQLASVTGIAAERIDGSDGRLVGTFRGTAATLNYPLPAGVSLSYFVPSSSQEKGFVSFTSSYDNLTKLNQVLADLGNGISVTLPLQKYSTFVGDKTFVYQLRLSSSSPKVKVEKITLAP